MLLQKMNQDIGDLESLSCNGLDSIKNLADAIQDEAVEKPSQRGNDKIYAFAISIEQLAQTIRENFYKILEDSCRIRKKGHDGG